MPKMKTNSGSKKRFTLTGTGKIKRKHAFHSHILTKKTKKQKRNLCYSTTVDITNMSQVKELLAMKKTKTYEVLLKLLTECISFKSVA